MAAITWHTSPVFAPAWAGKLVIDSSLSVVIRLAVIAGSTALWFAGLRLFLRSGLATRRKQAWVTLLLLAGIGIGALLSSSEVWSKFVLLMAVLPMLAVADVLLFRSGRTVGFWIRACGFEVCTVFAAAAAARYLFDLAGITALVRPTG